MLPEQEQVVAYDGRPPPHVARVFSVTCDHPAQVLARMKEAWSVIAGLGRWSDDSLGDWPDSKSIVSAMPAWLAEHLQGWPGYEVENWLDALHDRTWIWWSACVVAGEVRITIDAEASPLSWWPLQAVALAAGARAAVECPHAVQVATT